MKSLLLPAWSAHSREPGCALIALSQAPQSPTPWAVRSTGNAIHLFPNWSKVSKHANLTFQKIYMRPEFVEIACKLSGQ